MSDQVVDIIAKLVIERLHETYEYKIPIGVSNRHVHLCREDLDKLFGQGYELTKMKDLSQPSQYAAKETITIIGPKGEIEKVRILGPLRSKSQIEISLTDGFRLGINAPIRESGILKDTPGLSIIGPKGILHMDNGTIVALRHIHMTKDTASKMGVKDKDIVSVETHGERCGVLGNVLVRVSDQFQLEMHIDLDEANAFALKNGDYVILKKE